VAIIRAVAIDDDLRRARAGDGAAMAALLAKYQPRVAELAHRQLQRRCRAQEHRALAAMSTGDIVQDVLVEVFKGLDRWEGDTEERFVGLLATLVEYRLIELLRGARALQRDERRHSGTGAETAGVTDLQRSPATIAMTHEQLAVYHEVLATFADRERVLLVRRLEDGEEFAQLAADLAYPSADAARKAFHGVHAKLLLRLRGRGLEPPAPAGSAP
jgi:RNA polymerase sigma factor (sigma-70 family)